MDTYCEQLVKMRKGAKYYFCMFGIWFAEIVFAFFCLVVPYLRFLSAILIVASGYGAYYLCGFLSVEYEYIITNGTLDIDIIYSKRTRKRLASYELSDVESIEKYSGDVLDKHKYRNLTVACNTDDPQSYKLLFSGDNGISAAVISPNERTREEIVKFVPKFVGNTAFKQ